GSGTPAALPQKALVEKGYEISENTIAISDRAHVIMPYHRIIDTARDCTQGIGTTGRGIGPAYEDKARRLGIRVIDLVNEAFLRRKLDAAFEEKQEYITRILKLKPLDKESMFDRLAGMGSRIKPFVKDVAVLVAQEMAKGRNLLFEGAQGANLDMDHGTYPYVTSSNTIAGQACVGTGIGPTAIDMVVGICKAYTTRVGGGPFPTELKDEIGERLRAFGGEYGATTGRPRRCGWLDLVSLRNSMRLSGISRLAITKLDVLSGLETLRVATAYRIDGRIVEDMPANLDMYPEVEVLYDELPGWEEPLSDIRSLDALPKRCRDYISYLEDRLGVKTAIVSVGPRREETIVLEDIFPS
ncbi:MAG TPA: adenylosuccinate synthase, partial [Deltaproteobacteria bacterium]|nr:adenylosuccinate synthase [Deltaproteobacteria bacterium]